MTTREILISAKKVVPQLAGMSSEDKNRALSLMAEALTEGADNILSANAKDLEKAQANGMGQVMQDRLRLDYDRICAMAKGITEVIDLPDPIGEVLNRIERPNGIIIEKVSVPMGVVGIIYESRPNVTSDAAALSLKSGNVCVLRGGKEAFLSSNAIVKELRKGLSKGGFSENLINIIEDTSRDSANELMTAVGLVDLLIPRGGAGLISACVANAKVPCIQTGTGICHIYVDKSADFEKALNIIENAKTSRPSVCNAAEVCLVDKAVSEKFLPLLQERLVTERVQKNEIPVQLRLDEISLQYINGQAAGEKDFDTEFLDYIMAVKVVDGVTGAIEHIDKHSTHHSDAIITNDDSAARIFTSLVDSAAVYVNASTRFTDGGEFGLGCEIGISTQKLHARGPMGLKEITTYKYIVRGNGQIR